MKNDKIIIFCGPSGAGKTTIMRRFCEKYGDVYAKCISCTTRQKREGEEDKLDYYFLDKNEFEDKISKGEFVEYNTFDGEYYGTLYSEIEKYYMKKNCVMIVDPFSICRVRELDFFKNKNLMTFFLDADDEVLKKRLERRGETQSEIDRKLLRARNERRSAPCCDYVVFVESLDEVVDKIYKVLNQR